MFEKIVEKIVKMRIMTKHSKILIKTKKYQVYDYVHPSVCHGSKVVSTEEEKNIRIKKKKIIKKVKKRPTNLKRKMMTKYMKKNTKNIKLGQKKTKNGRKNTKKN